MQQDPLDRLSPRGGIQSPSSKRVWIRIHLRVLPGSRGTGHRTRRGRNRELASETSHPSPHPGRVSRLSRLDRSYQTTINCLDR
jgi:hypothetical protein